MASDHLIHPVAIGDLELADNLALAPMAGYTNVACRSIVKRVGGCGLVAGEMVAAIAAPTRAQERRRQALLRILSEERPVAMQVYGRDPSLAAELARSFVAAGADLVDINCGCPVRKAVRAGCGVALMREPDLVARLVAAVRAAVAVPVTVKLRLGFAPGEFAAPAVAAAAAEAGAAGVFVHARPGGVGYESPPDWAAVASVKAAVAVPVFVGGDLRRAEDLCRAHAASGADGFQIGRAACGDPWVFRRIADELAGRQPYRPTRHERRELLERHFALLLELHGEERGTVIMRSCAGFYCRGLPGVRELRRRWVGMRSRKDFERLLDGFFSKDAEDGDQ